MTVPEAGWEDVYAILKHKLDDEDRVKVITWFTKRDLKLLETKFYAQFCNDHTHITPDNNPKLWDWIANVLDRP